MGKTQQEYAELTGIERSTLANYEAEVTPLRYDQAKRICYRLNINQVWLATGANPFVPYFDLSPNLEFSIKQNALFSDAFDNVLKKPIQDQIDTLVTWIGAKDYFSGKYDNSVLDSLHLAGEEPGKAAGFYVGKVISMKFHWMPEQFRPGFAQALIDAEARFWKQHGMEISKVVRERQARDAAMQKQMPPPTPEKSAVDNISETVNIDDVKPMLPSLLDRLRLATIERGKKSELAKFLGVSLVQVSQWLTGDREPGGETTLRLLHWVQQQERQK